MPVTPTYPGVYIEELTSSVRTITGVSTSVTAFVGYTQHGPVNTPVTLTSFADFERRFGGLSQASPLSYSVQQFFLNGGSIAVVVRLAPGAGGATADFGDSFTVTATEPGTAGDSLRVAVDPAVAEGTFDLRVFDTGGRIRETYRGVTLDTIEQAVNATSAVVRVQVAAEPAEPDPSGTVSGAITGEPPDVTGKDFEATVTATGGGENKKTIRLYDDAAQKPKSLAELAVLLERKLRTADPGDPGFAAARVTVVGDRLHILPGSPDSEITLIGPAASTLKLQDHSAPASTPLSGGADGTPPQEGDFVGSAADKSGLYALADVPDLNLLVIPELATLGDPVTVMAQANRLCEDRRAFFIADTPASWTSLDAARAGLGAFDSVRNDHAALYFPHIRQTDPLTGQLREFPPSGAIAGIYAATDTARGVWKAPAGTEAGLTGVRALTVPLTDPENGLINPLGLNALRSFPVIGPVVWGARTLAGADATPSQWKYVPVRRLALFLEESLYRGTKWVVFEPNDEPLWGQIRLNVGAFLHTLFLQGAFQGTSARAAYFVKCDKTTTTQDDVNRGVVNIVVGFAPLKPAEFVVIQIEQITGQIDV
ncbi:phage tail sheath subtilisin-like domain-containing protein [Amycolatopsis mongoliensis]|uniref:Phage tail sheath subtilisin-like domain-containing protein n=1 Tax=Amycolatopsis mongoliensis TaxID=715475 RepID=A0A9Y2JLR2_9PSEU|nr:phage tail sheath C-terminal domain-containing protein [Amycolatopsis sp. 4-36]WIX99163.1 phage tail sheath subtilisin-like domain-containing protein [Amycolatopsis sp. 4-36]